jgi:hypothetical protein
MPLEEPDQRHLKSAHGVSSADVAFFLESFPSVRRKDEGKYGTYCTKDTIIALSTPGSLEAALTTKHSPLHSIPGRGIYAPATHRKRETANLIQ